MNVIRISKSLTLVLILNSIAGCSHKLAPESVLLNGEIKTKAHLNQLIASDSAGSFSFCYEMSSDASFEKKEESVSCKIVPLTGLYLTRTKSSKFNIEPDSTFFMALVYRLENLEGLLKAKKVDSTFNVVSWTPIKNEDGNTNGSSTKVLMDLLNAGKKIYTIRYNEEHYVFAYPEQNTLKVSSFAYGNFKNYASTDEWVKTFY